MSAGRPRTVLVVGPPGAGKSTLCAAIRDRAPDAVSFAVRLRYQELVRRGDPLGARIDEALKERGKYIPDHLVGEMFGGFLDEVAADELLLLEGFPINAEQFRLARERLAGAGRRIDKLLLLSAELPVLWERVSRRRTCPRCEVAEQAGRPVPDGVDSCPTCLTPVARRPDDRRSHLERRYRDFTRERDAILSVVDPDRVDRLEVGGLGPEEVVDEGLQRLGLA